MHNTEKDAALRAEKQKKAMETAFRLFTEKSIDAVSMNDIARESGVGIATLYRYYENKVQFVTAISVWKWEEYQKVDRPPLKYGDNGPTGAEIITYFLDSFLDLYRNHKDLLRFNQNFNIFIRGENADGEAVASYSRMIDRLAVLFQQAWERGARDGTLCTDTPWKQAFSAILHLMLAAVTRYAVGLVYQTADSSETESELVLLRNMLLQQYVRGS
ncbi:MAG: TetR/AcrR family transcriptional regulator [Clostridia bacterium]|nr:TetR/AcrR family transcriptional regulator [Clostridia bacterium]